MSEDFGRVQCGTCGKNVKFPRSKAGKVAKCPGCSEPLRLVDRSGPKPELLPALGGAAKKEIRRPTSIAPLDPPRPKSPPPKPAPQLLDAKPEQPQAGGTTVNVIVTGAAPGQAVAAQPNSSRTTAALLALLAFGAFGSHKLYMGKPWPAAIMAATSLVGSFGACLLFPLVLLVVTGGIALVEGIIYLSKSDEQFHAEYIAGGRNWF